MKRFIVRLCMWVLVSLAMPAFAQDQSSGETEAAAAPSGQSVSEARAARDAGDFSRALELLEAAHHADPENGEILYERVLTLESMGEVELALRLIEEHRDLMIRHPDVNDLAVVEQRLISAKASENAADAEESDPGQGDEQVAGGGPADGEADPVTPTPAASKALGYGMTAGGAVLVATGLALVVVAEMDAADLVCAGLAPDPGCAPSDLDPNITRAQYDERRSSISTLRLAGAVAMGIGVGALAYGLFELFDDEPDATSFHVVPSSNGAAIGLTHRF